MTERLKVLYAGTPATAVIPSMPWLTAMTWTSSPS